MTDFSSDFDIDGGAGDRPVPLHRLSDGPPPPQEEERAARFGRGWVPSSRDIGIPGEQGGAPAGPGATERFREREGDGPRIFSSSSDFSNDDDTITAPLHAWDAARKVRFLDHLADKGDVRAACAGVGMSRMSAYRLRRRDGAFSQAWQAALVLARAHAEEVLATRALDGTEEAVWFRGEVVGRRRKYDTRLLLAHLARLDRAAEAGGVGAEAIAERFDEMLGIVAGERPGLGTDDLGGADAAELPPTRTDYLGAHAAAAWIEARGEWIDAVEALGGEDGGGQAPDAQGGEPDYPPAPERSDLHRECAARWDAWQSRAFARVDALLAGELEYKSLGGSAGMRPAEIGPGEGGGQGALDRVTRVTFTARRRRSAAGQKVLGAGNDRAGSPLSGVKAGAALPPPLPSCAGRHLPPPQNREWPASVRGQLDRTASSTLPLPLPRMPISSAAASDRSMTRLP